MKKAIFSITCLVLAACASQSGPKNNDEILLDLAERIATAPDSVTYSKFWNTYLQSEQVLNTVAAQERYLEAMGAIASGEKRCEDVDWEALSGLDIVSLMPHISAVECFESVGNVTAAARHQNLFNFIVTGILTPNSGEAYYSAYEVASWGDAADLLELSGYQVIDSYFEFHASRSGLYRAYNVREENTGAVSKIYFDNSRFLHRILDGQYPFAGISDALYESIVLPLVETDYAARHGQGMALYAEKNYPLAEDAFLTAISMGSITANLSLGKLCLEGKSQKFSTSECAQLFVTASDQGLEEAKIMLAYMSYLGLGIDVDVELGNELLESAATSMPAGRAELEMSQLLESDKFTAANSALSTRFLTASAEKGYPPALFKQALVSINGAVGQDGGTREEVYTRLIRRAADAEYPPAQYMWAVYLLDVKKQVDPGLELMNKAAAAGFPSAHYQLGRIAERGMYGQKRDELQAFINYQAAAIRWHASAQFKMGLFNTQGKAVYKDHDIAYGWYSLCAKVGNLDCITNLGYAAEMGYGVPRDYAQAAEIYHFAAKQGFPRANFNLGNFYHNGLGVDQDTDQARQFYTVAADGGSLSAMNRLGLLFLESDNEFHDYQQALAWFERAAEGNSKYGFFNQARMYSEGLGVNVDLARALSLYLEASNRGHGTASLKAAEMYAAGEGVAQDEEKSIQFLKLAALQGESSAVGQLNRLCKEEDRCGLTIDEVLRLLPDTQLEIH